jgi:uncharacterized membrane protein
MYFFHAIIESVSFFIGLFGLGIILTGAVKAGRSYFSCPDGLFRRERKILAEYLILGLDFLVCKDVIDTLLLDTGARFWEDLAGLVTVVIVRIVLTHFMTKELHEIADEEKLVQTKKTTKSSKKRSKEKSVETKK